MPNICTNCKCSRELPFFLLLLLLLLLPQANTRALVHTHQRAACFKHITRNEINLFLAQENKWQFCKKPFSGLPETSNLTSWIMALIFKYLSTLTFISETNLQLVFRRSHCLRSCLCLERPLLRLIALVNHSRQCSSTTAHTKKNLTRYELASNVLLLFFLIKALIIYFLDCNGTAWLTHTRTHTHQ